MKLISLKIKNFRSIQTFDWTPGAPFVCIIGKGDIGKSTILDAIEAVLSPKRIQFFDTDFFNCNIELPIEITAVVGELSNEAIKEDRMGKYLQGISATGELSDEPKVDSDAVVTVRLTVEKDLDPKWELINGRSDPRALYSKDRSVFGLVRLGAETESHLTWGQYSHLAKLCEQKGGATNVLTQAFRKAKETVKKEKLKELNDAAEMVRAEAVRIGAYSSSAFEAGLDTQRLLSSLSGLSLHTTDIPLRMSGLGSRRLTALAIQRLSVPDGAIVLIDELEHGLEPHRIRHAVRLLKKEVGDQGVGQVILTTHSPIPIVELTPEDLRITLKSGGAVRVARPNVSLQRQMRVDPESLLSQKVIVGEGKTEKGILRALCDRWEASHDGESLAFRGVALADGEGSSGPSVAKNFAELGYPTCLFRDSDVPLSAAKRTELAGLGINIIEWPGTRSTEGQVLKDISQAGVQQVLEFAYAEFSKAPVLEAIRKALGFESLPSDKFVDWLNGGKTEEEVRAAIARAAEKYKEDERSGWFKRIDRGQKLGEIIVSEITNGLASELTQTLDQVETWAYAG